MTTGNYGAIYDFELMPYALGDVLTWNVQTAIRCEEAGRERVDVFICLDERYPSSIYQRGLVTPENCGLFFNELLGAFGTHPRLGNIYVYRRREEMLERLADVAKADSGSAEAVADYERVLGRRDDEPALIEYFTKYIYFHERINGYAQAHGRIPLLGPSVGCGPDIAGLIEKRFAGRKIVAIHTRLRRLDAGYGGEHTYDRDSDFLEWYDFLREAGHKHPDVQFVLLGRLQEKPLEFLKLPNVLSLRTLGLGLGHELTLMLQSDLFIGTSSGFAAMANFSRLPYFITKMTPESCNAYRIEPRAERLPFATDRQILVYEPETRELLMRLLESGLEGVAPRSGTPVLPLKGAVDVRSWEWERSRWLHPGATTYRFFLEDTYSDKETAFLLWPRVKEAQAAEGKGLTDDAWTILTRVDANFPRVSEKFPEFLRLKGALAVERNEWAIARSCEASLGKLSSHDDGLAGFPRSLRRHLTWAFPLARQLRRVWERKHRIPAKLAQWLTRLARTGRQP